MGLRRAAIALPAVKGLIFGLVGVVALALSFGLKGPEWSFVPFALFVYSLPFLVAATVFLLASFLLARARMVWRAPGALLDAAATLLMSWALVAFFFGARDAYGDLPLAISIAAALTWAGTLIPASIGLFRKTSLATGSAGSSKR